MKRLLANVGPVVLTIVSVVLAASAYGAPGDAIKLGTSTTMSPDLDLGLQYRTNINQTASAVDRRDGLNLTVAPGVEILHNTPSTEFRFVGDYRLQKYFTEATSFGDRYNDFDLSARGSFLKDRPVGIVLRERAALLNNNATGRVASDNPLHTRLRNDLGVGLAFRPGQVLDLGVGGGWALDNYRVPEGAQAGVNRDLNTRNSFGPEWSAQWRFFPRTAVVIDGGFQLNRWASNWMPEGERGTFLAMPDSNFFRMSGGLRGRLTERVVLITTLGYGSGQYLTKSVTDACGGAGAECTPSAANQFDAKLKGAQRLLAQLQLQYSIDESKTLTIGYQKDFDDSFFTNYMAYNRVFTKLNSKFGNKVSTDLSLTVSQESYRGERRRDDVFVDGRADVSYYLQDWAKVTAGVGYQQRTSPSEPSVNYSDVQARLLTTIAY
ncbi:MAG: hypothetical protein ACI9MC_001973 [Kiritimatiellia bacterium]|jgi:hypothetical protein